MFSTTTVYLFYIVQLVSVLIWCIGAWRLLEQQKRYQHPEWHIKCCKALAAYSFCETFRIVDGSFPDYNTGIVYSVWGVVPWWVKLYSWVARDVILFTALCVYLEHSVVWTHCYLGRSVPKSMLVVQRALCYLGNLIFLVGCTAYMIRNDQFWQMVCALGQVPPNIVFVIVNYQLSGCLKKIPDCEELRHTRYAKTLLLIAGCTVLLVFPPWALPKMMKLYSQPRSAHPTLPSGNPIFSEAAPSFLDHFGGGGQLDLLPEFVEFSVGWCGYLGLSLRKLRKPGPGESLVVTSEEIAGSILEAEGRKRS